MNMISARVPSDCIGCGDEDNSSHDSTVIKLRLVCFEYAPSSGELTYCAFKRNKS